MAFSFFFLQEHLWASHNVRRTLRSSTVQRKQARCGIVTITWWASHRFQTPQSPQSSKASVWSSTHRLPARPPVTLLTICSPALLCNAVKVLKVAQDGRKELRDTLCTLYNCRSPRTRRLPQHTRARTHAQTNTALLCFAEAIELFEFKPSARVAHFGPGEGECDTRPPGRTT